MATMDESIKHLVLNAKERVTKLFNEYAATAEQLKLFNLLLESSAPFFDPNTEQRHVKLAIATYLAAKKEIPENWHEDACLQYLIAIINLVNIGIEFLDDIADGGLNECWTGIPTEVLHLVAHNLLGVLVPLLILQMPTAAEQKNKLQIYLYRTFLKISSGQEKDIQNMVQTEYSLDKILALMALKSGYYIELTAGLAVLAANAQLEDFVPLLDFAHDLGMLRQLRNDCYDLFVSEEMYDFRNGLLTYPILLFWHDLDAGKKAGFLQQLQMAKQQPKIAQQVRTLLLDNGYIFTMTLLIAAHEKRLREKVEYANIPAEVKDMLFEVLNSAELLFEGIFHKKSNMEQNNG